MLLRTKAVKKSMLMFHWKGIAWGYEPTHNFIWILISDKHGGGLIRDKNVLLFTNTWFHPRFLVETVLLIVLVFCVMLCFVCLRCVSCVPNVTSVSGLSILDCFFSFSLTFLNNKQYPLKCKCDYLLSGIMTSSSCMSWTRVQLIACHEPLYSIVTCSDLLRDRRPNQQ